jgi:hypothetical protein
VCGCDLACFSASTGHVPTFTLRNLSWITLSLTKKSEAEAERISPYFFSQDQLEDYPYVKFEFL